MQIRRYTNEALQWIGEAERSTENCCLIVEGKRADDNVHAAPND
ncbi:MAG: hypothetical protein ABSD76_08895 [Terriglobales bacterium]